MAKRIVIVDDEIDICDLFGEILKREFDVATFNNFLETGDYIDKTKIDVLIVDYYVPGKITCLELIEKAKQKNKETKIILVTGKLYLEDHINTTTIDEIIYKPMSLSLLLETVKKVIKG